MSFLEALGLIAQIVAFAALVALVLERIVEAYIKPVIPDTWAWRGQVLIAVPAVLGLAVAAGFQIDLFSPVAEALGLHPLTSWAGVLLTGLVMGGGANLIHDLWPGGPGGNG